MVDGESSEVRRTQMAERKYLSRLTRFTLPSILRRFIIFVVYNENT